MEKAIHTMRNACRWLRGRGIGEVRLKNLWVGTAEEKVSEVYDQEGAKEMDIEEELRTGWNNFNCFRKMWYEDTKKTSEK